ncbi:MAG: hypothetical protein OEV49_17215 [candidate division Zixibacteria bacterium]|nr:hypothetical protein [candidate division Zixibacteria bacterium]MDH4034741.1 hypothetical protein [candidate division Zixibacteria bacterium]
MTTRFIQLAVAILILVAGGELTGGTKSTGVTDSCCVGPIRGNVDNDQDDLIDITDVVYLVDYMFQGGPAPLCLKEADIDGSTTLDPSGETPEIAIGDLIHLVDFLFAGGRLPVPCSPADQWENIYGGVGTEIAYSVAATSDGGYIVAGSVWANGADIYLIRTDAWGDTLWTRTFGTPLDDEAYYVAVTPDGGFILTGNSGNSNQADQDVYVVKISAVGDLVWERRFGEPGWSCGYSVVPVSGGGYLVAGALFDSSQHYRASLIRLNESGDSLWSRRHSAGDLSTSARSMAKTPDGGYILTGWQEPHQIWLLKTDSLGHGLWSRTYEGGHIGSSVIPTADGGYIVTGTSDYPWDDLYVLKTDSLGEPIWSREFGENAPADFGRSVLQADDGNYVIAGMLDQYFEGGENVCLIKLDSMGNDVWIRTYGGSDQDRGTSVAKTGDGGYIITGIKDDVTDSATGWDVYLIKTDAEGFSQ